MTVSLIVAKSENNVIGVNGDLPWHLPDDMRFFKKTTSGHHVIMGRKNYDSIPEKYRPLSNRTNIVLSRNKELKAEGCISMSSIEEALNLAKKNNDTEPFIIGGGQIYKLALENKLVNKMYITQVGCNINGDVFFPEVDYSEWSLVSEYFHPKDEKHEYSFIIFVYKKKRS